MKIREGQIIRSVLDRTEFTVKKVLREWIALKSQNAKRKIMTDGSTLNDKLLYRKRRILRDDIGCH